MKNLRLFLPIVSILFFVACSKDAPVPPDEEDENGTLELLFEPTMNGAAYQPNQLFVGPNGLRMNIETFKFYLSDIWLLNSGDSLLASEVELADMNSTTGKSLQFRLKPGSYNAIRLGIGVSEALNGTNDPDFNEAQFSIDHPLSIYNNMYWTWASGYIFAKMEGKLDTSAAQNQTPTFTWFYHSGMDTLYTQKKFEGLNFSIEKGKTTTLKVGLEVNSVFTNGNDTLNMVDSYFTHTTDNLPLARRIIEGLGRAMVIQQ